MHVLKKGDIVKFQSVPEWTYLNIESEYVISAIENETIFFTDIKSNQHCFERIWNLKSFMFKITRGTRQ